jgi:hypothetical protein
MGFFLTINVSTIITRRSYILEVTSSSVRSKPPTHNNFTPSFQYRSLASVDKKICARQPTVATTTAQVVVIYVNAKNAKEAKNALESLGLLNRRYKMIKVNHNNHDDNLIAIPVTESFSDLASAVREVNYASRLKQLIVKSGTETVPFSSSLMGRMKQKR